MSELGVGVTSEMKHLLEDAYSAAKTALTLLDQAGAPARIGAHFDHGISEIEKLLRSTELKRA